ncbi:hypothetical protein GF394_00875 [Candidatus Fermentibacteria bacterium]|nr:hypothetical protein [Candidatus Fermentibacteria bacterium]
MNISGHIPPGSHDLIDTDGQEDYTEFMHKIAKEIVQRQLTVPAIIFLETIKPLSFLGNQLLIFANPVVSLVVRTGNYYKFVRMIEHRENVEKLTVAIEEENAREIQRKAKLKEEKKRRKKRSFFGWLTGKGTEKTDSESCIDSNSTDKEVDGGGQQRDHQNNGD